MDDMSIGLGKIEYERNRPTQGSVEESPIPRAEVESNTLQGASLGLGNMSYECTLDVNPSQLAGTPS